METLMIADPPSGGQAFAGGELTTGMVLDDRFNLMDLVSRSNMASIFKAYDLKTHEAVAIKVPLLSVESDLGGYERFKREEETHLHRTIPAF